MNDREPVRMELSPDFADRLVKRLRHLRRRDRFVRSAVVGASVAVAAALFWMNLGDGVTVKRLENVNLCAAAKAPIVVEAGEKLVLELEGDNYLASEGEGVPAIQVAAGGELTIRGSGTLRAKGGPRAAAIGAGGLDESGRIAICGGRVTATGGDYGPGIGAWAGRVGEIEISGGTVIAESGDILHEGVETAGAGIGGGYTGDVDCGGCVLTLVNITGGFVEARGYGCPGIGPAAGERTCGEVGKIRIAGGVVRAVAKSAKADKLWGYSPGIGGSSCMGRPLVGSCGDIEISGGEVYAEGVFAGIGGARFFLGKYSEKKGRVAITGGTVTAKALGYHTRGGRRLWGGWAIGSGDVNYPGGDLDSVQISGGTLVCLAAEPMEDGVVDIAKAVVKVDGCGVAVSGCVAYRLARTENGRLRISFSGSAVRSGVTYALETSSDGSVWQATNTVVSAASFELPTAGAEPRYYRLVPRT